MGNCKLLNLIRDFENRYLSRYLFFLLNICIIYYHRCNKEYHVQVKSQIIYLNKQIFILHIVSKNGIIL